MLQVPRLVLTNQSALFQGSIVTCTTLKLASRSNSLIPFNSAMQFESNLESQELHQICIKILVPGDKKL